MIKTILILLIKNAPGVLQMWKRMNCGKMGNNRKYFN